MVDKCSDAVPVLLLDNFIEAEAKFANLTLKHQLSTVCTGTSL